MLEVPEDVDGDRPPDAGGEGVVPYTLSIPADGIPVITYWVSGWRPEGSPYRISLQREGRWVADAYGYPGQGQHNDLAGKVIHYLTGGVHMIWHGEMVLVADMKTIREVNLQVL